MAFKVGRTIGIDAGHRVPTHGSKCANLHGHRYTITAEVESASLNEIERDEQQDMVTDFGFIKEVMMYHIDRLCDHGFILWRHDSHLINFIGDGLAGIRRMSAHFEAVTAVADPASPAACYFQEGQRGHPTKLVVVPFIPTAERLAEWWFHLMKQDIYEKSSRVAHLARVVVWETPNCCAVYPAEGNTDPRVLPETHEVEMAATMVTGMEPN
jgi:6-pyruvoyltetrahydropterin/6-carboxytetrahydropterin synthase